MGQLFIYISIPLFAVYFFLFQRTISMLDETERARFINDAGQPRWQIAIIAIAMILLVVLTTRYARAAVGLGLLAYVAQATIRHHRRLSELGFDPKFTRRLARVSTLSGGIVALFVMGMVLNVR